MDLSRVCDIVIAGKTYKATFTARVIAQIESKFGSVSEWEKTMSEEPKLHETIWILQQMIAAGQSYMTHMGLPDPGIISLEEMEDVLFPDELPGLIGNVKNIVTAASQVKIEAEPAKKAETTDK